MKTSDSSGISQKLFAAAAYERMSGFVPHGDTLEQAAELLNQTASLREALTELLAANTALYSAQDDISLEDGATDVQQDAVISSFDRLFHAMTKARAALT